MIRAISSKSGLHRLAFAGAGLLLIGAASSMADAAPRCPEGRTAAGECINPGLALNARRSSIMFAQPKLSATAFPVLPSSDSLYRYPHDLIYGPQGPAPIGPFRVINGQIVYSP
jgi:hypothetical protein